MAAKRTRRARGRPQGGSEDIVRAILDATLAQLEASGFVELRVDDVAKAAGVNKTSVYRRFPTKGELVLAALRSRREADPPFVESGDLRKDLVDVLGTKAAAFSTPRGRMIMRALMAFDDEAGGPMSAFREQRYALPRAVLARAVERGALPPGSDPVLLADMLLAPVLHQLLIAHGPIDAAFLGKVVDQVLAGAGAVAAPPAAKRPRTRSKQL